MGIDCRLLTEKNNITLDRWHVFNCYDEVEAFEEGKIYNKKEFIKKLNICKKYALYEYEYNKNKKELDYILFWLNKVKKHIGNINVFFSDSRKLNISDKI
jgi:hypothetical protein